MPAATTDLLAEIVENKSPDVRTLLGLRDRMHTTAGAKPAAEKALDAWKASRERQGILLYLMGQVDRALSILETEASLDAARHFLARALADSGYYSRAEEILAEQFKKNRTPEIGLPLFRVQVMQDRLEEAGKTLKALGDEQNPDIAATRAEYMWRTGDLAPALDLIEELLLSAPENRTVRFSAGLLAQAAGDDDTARLCFERIVQRPPVSVDVLVNLGILYEDEEDWDGAIRCYEAVLHEYPRHPRAKLYKRDAEASKNMYYDEDRERREDKRLQVLRTPVTDFELSVRSRNCLAKMKIDTLGDLILKTESELLGYKNFGETSLQEIKSILASKGLRLGMRKEDALAYEPPEEGAPIVAPAVEDVTTRGIDTLQLSVRSRRCMERLGITTVSELLDKSESELLGAPNFGQTSLNEVRQKLSELGISLNRN